jgi:hypothetical protein
MIEKVALQMAVVNALVIVLVLWPAGFSCGGVLLAIQAVQAHSMLPALLFGMPLRI